MSLRTLDNEESVTLTLIAADLWSLHKEVIARHCPASSYEWQQLAKTLREGVAMYKKIIESQETTPQV